MNIAILAGIARLESRSTLQEKATQMLNNFTLNLVHAELNNATATIQAYLEYYVDVKHYDAIHDVTVKLTEILESIEKLDKG